MPAAAEDADVAALIWIRPMPRPPTAPASSPSRSSTGRFSISDFFFTVFPFVVPTQMYVQPYFSIPVAISKKRKMA